MNRKKALENKEIESKTYADLEALHQALSAAFREDFDRNLPFTEELFDRWDKARQLNWGQDTSVYESSYIYGQPEVGEKFGLAL